MNIPNLKALKGLAGIGRAFVLAHRPEMLFGASVVATVGSTVLAAKGGYEARGLVEEELERQFMEAEVSEPEQASLTTKEKALLTWRCYVPAGLALTTAVGSTTGLHLIHVKEKKALVATGLTALDELKDQYQQYEKENTIGTLSTEEKQKLLEERAENTPIGENRSSHIQNSDGALEEMYLVRDMRTGRDIWSNRHRIEDAIIEVNHVLNGSGDVELNHFYRHAGFSSVPEGHKVGWSGSLVGLEWDTTVRDDGRPVVTYEFQPSPEAGYDAP